jgi:multidrug resistance efflux pump
VPVRILLEGEASALGRLRPGLSVVAKVDMRTVAPQTLSLATPAAARPAVAVAAAEN